MHSLVRRTGSPSHWLAHVRLVELDLRPTSRPSSSDQRRWRSTILGVLEHPRRFWRPPPLFTLFGPQDSANSFMFTSRRAAPSAPLSSRACHLDTELTLFLKRTPQFAYALSPKTSTRSSGQTPCSSLIPSPSDPGHHARTCAWLQRLTGHPRHPERASRPLGEASSRSSQRILFRFLYQETKLIVVPHRTAAHRKCAPASCLPTQSRSSA
ncbi:hypothetical protein C2E23DRAFT_219165 [Lenzites betulinus]|nr:hypothetical protein C2E23DRAFT_219165 [Lenzites betulinus]